MWWKGTSASVSSLLRKQPETSWKVKKAPGVSWRPEMREGRWEKSHWSGRHEKHSKQATVIMCVLGGRGSGAEKFLEYRSSTFSPWDSLTETPGTLLSLLSLWQSCVCLPVLHFSTMERGQPLNVLTELWLPSLLQHFLSLFL